MNNPFTQNYPSDSTDDELIKQTLGDGMGDFKYYVETGKPSPGKIKDSNKQLKVAA